LFSRSKSFTTTPGSVTLMKDGRLRHDDRPPV